MSALLRPANDDSPFAYESDFHRLDDIVALEEIENSIRYWRKTLAFDMRNSTHPYVQQHRDNLIEYLSKWERTGAAIKELLEGNNE